MADELTKTNFIIVILAISAQVSRNFSEKGLGMYPAMSGMRNKGKSDSLPILGETLSDQRRSLRLKMRGGVNHEDSSQCKRQGS